MLIAGDGTKVLIVSLLRLSSSTSLNYALLCNCELVFARLRLSLLNHAHLIDSASILSLLAIVVEIALCFGACSFLSKCIAPGENIDTCVQVLLTLVKSQGRIIFNLTVYQFQI